MTATEKVMQLLVYMATEERHDTPEAVREAFGDLDDELSDAKSELRSGTHRTGLACEWSRHYESDAVAAQMLDGSWVGWTYWHGGGKHGEPRSIPWIEQAYDVVATPVQKVVYEFTLPPVSTVTGEPPSAPPANGSAAAG